jgi:tight adherence protein B
MRNEVLILIGLGLAIVLIAILIFWRVRRGPKGGMGGRRAGLRGGLNQYRLRVHDSEDILGTDTATSEPEEDSEAPEEDDDDSDTDNNELNLQARLKYANLAWMPPFVVSLLQIFVSLVLFSIAYMHLRLVLQILAICLGPLIVNGWINRRMRKRSMKFDSDFAQFLLATVGMLKTGLNTVQALQAASESLDDDSLVKQEIDLMLERLRMGVPEDSSIGSFGESIYQPEIELFVQALILSRRLGGTLSDTLDRLAKQVRKRQTFKRTATAAVSQQSGSIWVIIGIVFAVQLYMYFISPQMVIGAWTHPKLAGFAQCSIVIVFAAILAMKKVTNIKI